MSAEVDRELLALLRQQHKSHMALMRAVLTLSSIVEYLGLNVVHGMPATEKDKQRWQELREEFNKNLQDAIAALAGPTS
jgi:hypothetical protein